MRNMRTELWWEELKERDHLKDLGLEGKITIKRGLNI
jgi:hypothetical protein